jgi:hypothetical protein
MATAATPPTATLFAPPPSALASMVSSSTGLVGSAKFSTSIATAAELTTNKRCVTGSWATISAALWSKIPEE